MSDTADTKPDLVISTTDGLTLDQFASKMRASADVSDPTLSLARALGAVMFPPAAELVRCRGPEMDFEHVVNGVIRAGADVTMSLAGSCITNYATHANLSPMKSRELLDGAIEFIRTYVEERQTPVVNEMMRMLAAHRAKQQAGG